MNLHEDKLAFLNIINLVHEDSGIRSDILEKELLKMHIPVLHLVCYRNNKGKICVDIECDSVFANKFSKKVVEKVSEVCGKKLSEPIINNYGATSRIQLCEIKNFSVDFGFTQHAFGEGLWR